jgi:hypothetical protein
VVCAVDSKAAIFVPSDTRGPALIELIFALYDLSLCCGHICGKPKEGSSSAREVQVSSSLHRDIQLDLFSHAPAGGGFRARLNLAG